VPAGAEPEPEIELADVEAPAGEVGAPAIEPEPVEPPTEAHEEAEAAVEPAPVATVVAAEPAAPNGAAAAEAVPEQAEQPEPSASAVAADGLALPAAEALELLRRAGKDVIEPQFLLREYRRRVEQGEAAQDVRERLEALLAGRLRRIGALGDEQRLSLQID
jgi:hypothetical protein